MSGHKFYNPTVTIVVIAPASASSENSQKSYKSEINAKQDGHSLNAGSVVKANVRFCSGKN